MTPLPGQCEQACQRKPACPLFGCCDQIGRPASVTGLLERWKAAMSVCESCGAELDFALFHTDPSRPPMPVERKSAGQPGGNLAVRRMPDRSLRYRVLADGEDPGPGETRGKSHFAGCKDAASWRRARVCRRA